MSTWGYERHELSFLHSPMTKQFMFSSKWWTVVYFKTNYGTYGGEIGQTYYWEGHFGTCFQRLIPKSNSFDLKEQQQQQLKHTLAYSTAACMILISLNRSKNMWQYSSWAMWTPPKIASYVERRSRYWSNFSRYMQMSRCSKLKLIKW